MRPSPLLTLPVYHAHSRPLNQHSLSQRLLPFSYIAEPEHVHIV